MGGQRKKGKKGIQHEKNGLGGAEYALVRPAVTWVGEKELVVVVIPPAAGGCARASQTGKSLPK